MKLSAGEFKAKCLKLMDRVQTEHTQVVITKYGKPVAKLVPVDDDKAGNGAVFGYMRGTVKINGDIMKPVEVKWNANED